MTPVRPSGVDVYIGRTPPTMLASTLRRGRAAVTVRPGAVGLAEVLLAVVEAAKAYAGGAS